MTVIPLEKTIAHCTQNGVWCGNTRMGTVPCAAPPLCHHEQCPLSLYHFIVKTFLVSDQNIWLIDIVGEKDLSQFHSSWVHRFWAHSQEGHPGYRNMWKALSTWENIGIWEKMASHVTYTFPIKSQTIKFPEASKTVPQIENLFPNIWAYRGHFAQIKVTYISSKAFCYQADFTPFSTTAVWH